jgi:hypothetical protein
MKSQNNRFFVFAVIIGVFAFIACGGDNGGNGNIYLTGTITISPNTNVTVNTELTANYSGSEAVNYKWNKGGYAIGGETTNKYTPTEAGNYTVTVSLAGYKSKTSTGVVVAVGCDCDIGVTHEPGELCCEGINCECSIAESLKTFTGLPPVFRTAC